MTRKLLTALAVVLLAAPAAASAQIHTGISLAGGIALPTGDFKDGTSNGYKVDNGYNLAAGLNIGVPLLPIGVRIEGAYNRFGISGLPSGFTGNQDIISGTVNGTFGLGLPYVIGGLGYYSSKASVSGSGSTDSSDRTNAVGFNGGVGLRFPLGVISTFAEIRYHRMLGENNLNSATKVAANSAYIPITFGINF
jgi:opacity protein-like surface antigen